MAKTEVKLNIKGFRALRSGPEVREDLGRRAARISAAAGVGHDANVTVGRTRARASVVTASEPARRGEAENMTLTRALGAGR